MLVAHALVDLIADRARNIANIYAYSVHPGTARLLRRLGFSDPPATGAPISGIDVDGERRAPFLSGCETEIANHMNQIRLQCEFCQKSDRRARPWCLPRGQKPTRRPVQGGAR